MSTKTQAKAKASKVEQQPKTTSPSGPSLKTTTATPVAPVAPVPVSAPVKQASPAKPTESSTVATTGAPSSQEGTQKYVLKSYSKKIKSAIDDMTLLVYEIGKEGKISLDDGSTLTKRDIKGLKKGIYKLLDDLNVDFKNAKKKRAGSNKALLAPFFISSELVDFFYNVELGSSYRLGTNGEYEVEQKRLQSVLPPKGDGICIVNQMILNGLFSIYYRTHQLPSTGGWIKGDADLVKHLGGSMSELNLDPSRFKYFDFSRIRKHFKVDKEEYTEDLNKYLANPETQQLLEKATRSVHTTVSYLKSVEKERRRKELEAKRASQPPRQKVNRRKAGTTAPVEGATVTVSA
jgi:hypothetical protein